MPAPLCAALVLLVVGIISAQAEPVHLSGRVVDAASGAPLPGAHVRIAGLDRDAVTGSDGEFLVRGLPPGVHTIRVRLIGYHYAEQSIELTVSRTLAVSLRPNPVVLEGITVTADRMESRRLAAPVSVRTLTQERLRTGTNWNAADFITSHMGLSVVRCPGRIEAQCAVIRGRPLNLAVFIDERPAPGGLDELRQYQAWHLYLVEVYGEGRMIRAYSTVFIERLATKPRRLLPIRMQ